MTTVLRLCVALVAMSFTAGTAGAADPWGIEHEKKARFDATVVDILCELSGDCPENCGSGDRQLGLLRDDGTLVLPVKNQDIFAGTVRDLLPFCGQKITVDGLMIDDPLMPVFALQFKKPVDGDWSRANWFIRDWAADRDVARDSQTAREWYRNDPRVAAIIERNGVFGIPGLAPVE